jgi:hypothetical protein
MASRHECIPSTEVSPVEQPAQHSQSAQRSQRIDQRSQHVDQRSQRVECPSGTGHVVWIGPHEKELGWLHGRIAAYGRLTTLGAGSQAADRRPLEQVLQAGAHRLILACENRWDYPAGQWEWLRVHWPELPVAIATSSWWEGAGRTGVGHGGNPGLLIPWYRWWDAWWPWLEAESEEWFAPAGSGGWAVPMPPAAEAGVIIGFCGELLQGWRHSVTGGGLNLMSPQAIFQPGSDPWRGETPAIMRWCVIDDSSLSTVPHQDPLMQWSRLVQQCRELFPHSLIACAIQQPTWSSWQRLAAIGVEELLGGLETGQALSRMLHSHARLQGHAARQAGES